ncbi:MAG: capsule biosynthesis protein [Bacteroidales bacterium]|nr:capsule biosynthesis protein [Bacteroidales bacterium]
MRIKRFLLVLGLASLTVYATAQSSTDIQLAKQLAKQQGYSDAQIEAMMNQYDKGGKSATTAQQSTVDRNVAALQQQQMMLQQQQMMMQNYGVAAQTAAPAAETKQDGLLKGSDLIFGHNLFKNRNLNFVPSYNIPTPSNYKLSAGDEVVIDIWGDVISNITTTISPDGSVNIPNLGPVYLAGQTVEKAEKSLKSYLSKIYSGIAQEEPTTYVKLALGKTKTVTVNVVGDVEKPGSYTLPALSTIASAMYLAEGPNDLGTIRAINLYRNGKLISSFDIYEFIVNGTFNSNVRLEDNDVISVAPYSGVVTVMGGVKRPMKYEVKPGETLDKVLAYAGGFSDAAFADKVHVDRIASQVATGAAGESFDVMSQQYGSFEVKDGDVITVNVNNTLFKNKVNIEGAVWRPGTYAINGTTSTLKQLIQAAGGLRDDAHTERGIIQRLDENRQKQQLSFNVADVILGKGDITLNPDDNVQIFDMNDLQPERSVRIYGEVKSSGSRYDYREGMTIGDLILMAGGITDAATLAKVEVARRNVKSDVADPEPSDVVAEVMYFNLLKNPADADVKLKPFDIVFVRRNPTYKAQQSVALTGEVNYPGTYVVESSTVRLSDVIGRAQGFTNDAYVKGAKLTRTLNKEEFDRLKVAMEIAKKQANDSTAVDSLEIGESYTVAIDLARAIAEPGSVADVILREGDVISVPKYNSTVKISGAVLYPNVVSFDPKKSWNYYLSNAGGVTQDGVKRKVYMVHMNGSVATKGDANFKVQPGTEIIIPAKNSQQGGQNLASIMSIATSTASLAAMITTIVNQMK